jgi:hypothetical protein
MGGWVEDSASAEEGCLYDAIMQCLLPALKRCGIRLTSITWRGPLPPVSKQRGH